MGIIGSLGVPVAIVALAVGVLATLMFFARNYKKVAPNEVLVIYGGRRQGADRFVTAGGVFIWPVVNSVKRLSLRIFQVETKVEHTPNKDGVQVSVEAVANVKVSSDSQVLEGAAERLLDKGEGDLEKICKTTLEGILRQIVGTLTVEEIVRERQRLAQEVAGSAHTELGKLGFTLDNFVITKITDKEGYIDALGKRRTAEVKRDATIGEAEANKEATVKSSVAKREGEEARLSNEAQVAQAQRDLSLKQAGFKAETETADARAGLARQLTETEIREGLVRKEVAIEEARVKAQIGVAEQEIQRKERELQATQIKPAEARRQAAVIEAEGQAQAKVLQADADKKVTVAKAEADKVKLAAEGEGKATADAAQKREIGIAEAASIRAKGEAEGAAIQARVIAEALGLQKKNEALASMSDAARLIVVLERLPEIIEKLGKAGEQVVGSAFEHVGAGLSRIDSLQIVDMGGGNGDGHSPLTRYALSIPDIVFELFQKAKALGVNVGELLKPLGIDAEKLMGQLGKPSAHALEHAEK